MKTIITIIVPQTHILIGGGVGRSNKHRHSGQKFGPLTFLAWLT